MSHKSYQMIYPRTCVGTLVWYRPPRHDVYIHISIGLRTMSRGVVVTICRTYMPRVRCSQDSRFGSGHRPPNATPVPPLTPLMAQSGRVVEIRISVSPKLGSLCRLPLDSTHPHEGVRPFAFTLRTLLRQTRYRRHAYYPVKTWCDTEPERGLFYYYHYCCLFFLFFSRPCGLLSFRLPIYANNTPILLLRLRTEQLFFKASIFI
ncbi:hypothetical protein F5Y03DRAFT_237015 [Xylaria venustula]|nr:hypothetical protein F5Y03DRAFT_237015 [Xylaria venustula]